MYKILSIIYFHICDMTFLNFVQIVCIAKAFLSVCWHFFFPIVYWQKKNTRTWITQNINKSKYCFSIWNPCTWLRLDRYEPNLSKNYCYLSPATKEAIDIRDSRRDSNKIVSILCSIEHYFSCVHMQFLWILCRHLYIQYFHISSVRMIRSQKKL